jgi:TonB-dependent starch-binding outer membrane protein SusC
MKKSFNGILTLLLVFVVQLTFAQQQFTVTGTVIDDSGLPLPAVNVIVEGTNRGTLTDFDGNYSINVSTGEMLVFTYVGYTTGRIRVGTNTTIDVTLAEDAAQLDEVVVTGYGTVSQKKSSTAASTISAQTIENRPSGDVLRILQGQIPGLDIGTFSGNPGADATVILRGRNSINGNIEPLFIMDGVPINEDRFRALNPNEIASVTVLKDAGATAIYGSRGANGVVVIETKQGTTGTPLKINVSSILSFSSLQDTNKYDLLNAQDYLRLERLYGAGRGAGQATGNLFPGIGRDFTDEEIAAVETTDWSEIFFRTGLTKNNNVTLASGGAKATQFTSLGYYEQDGILRDSNLQRFNLRNNIKGSSSNDRFRYGTSVSLNYAKNNAPTNIGTTGVNQNPFFGAYLGLPYLNPQDQPTPQDLANGFFLSYGPFYTKDKLDTSVALEEETKVIASVNLSYDLTEDLTAGFVSGIDYASIIFLDTQHPISRNQLRFDPEVDGFQQQSIRREAAFNATSSLNWNKELGRHTLGLGAYLEYFKAHMRSFGYRQNGLDPKTFAPGDGAGFIGDVPEHDFRVPSVFANKLDAGLLSYFGALNYDFDDKYGISATVRRDASYRFASTNRWGTFYSVAARWNISEEAFMDGSFVSDLKIRGSYGTTGNQRITGNSYWSGADLPFTFFGTGQGYGLNEAIFLSQIGNSTLRWETVTQANIGLDFGFWNNRLSGSLDVYEKKTTDLFQNRPISGITGQFNINANIGSLYNRGIDLQVRYNLINTQDFRLALNFAGNYNESELADIPNERGEIIGIGRNGGIFGEYYNYRYAGVNPANGNLLYLTADGDVTENPNTDTDRVWLNKSSTPLSQGSFGFNMDYKGFFVTTQFNYEVGIDRYDIDLARFVDRDNIGLFQQSADIFRSWTPDNRVTDVPSLNATNLNFGGTRWLREADYLRLRFITVGYNVPTRFLDRTGVSNLRVFGNAENLFTWSKWRGFDPSLRAGSLSYPTPKIMSVGVEIGI